MTSFCTRSAISRSRSDSSSASMAAAASRIDIAHRSAMVWPAMVTPSENGLSRAPPHSGQGTSRM